jgi:hypothetical protein
LFVRSLNGVCPSGGDSDEFSWYIIC